MKRRMFSVLLVVSLVFSVLATGVFAAQTPAVSNNVMDGNNNDYWDYAYPACSNLEAHNDGYTRVEYIDGRGITIDQYDKQFKFLNHRELELELPIYGGVYLGTDYNFVVCGQYNGEEDDAQEVIRVIRYSKNWERQAAASIYGANTMYPFAFGGLDMAESGDMLYIRSCHQMYTSSDGLHHQANMQLCVRISDMTITEKGVDLSHGGYVSHSFKQLARIDGADYITVDHGDAFPRSVVLFKYENGAGAEVLQDFPSGVEVLPIAGEIGDNDTGVNVGGFEASDTAYLVAGASISQNSSDLSAAEQMNVFVTVTPKDNFTQEATQIKWFTNYPEGSDVYVGNPYLVKISSTQFMLMWNEGSQIKYVLLDANAEMTSQVYTAEGSLSGCHPIVANGKITWYNTKDTIPNFYQIDVENPENVQNYIDSSGVFEDVAPDAYYYTPVNWAVGKGVTAGISPTQFGPGESCTRAQIVTFLWAAHNKPDPVSIYNPFTDVFPSDYYYKAVLWAVENGITSGVTPDRFAPYNTCTRAQAVTFLWAAQNKPVSDSGIAFVDVAPRAYYAPAVQWAVANGVTAGVGNNKFGPSQNCTRAQIVTFLYKAMN